MTWRLAVDIGGTFTDVVLAGGPGERQIIGKVLTTPKDPAAGVMDGVRQVLRRAEVGLAEVAHVIHGTTLVTNALIERKGARTGLVTSEGHEDVARHRARGALRRVRPVHREAGAARARRPARRDLRAAAQRRQRAPARRSRQREAAVRRLVDAGAETVAVSLLHSYREPAHERAVAEIVRARRTRRARLALVSGCAEIREYERTSTTVANAYVLPSWRRTCARSMARCATTASGARCSSWFERRHVHGRGGVREPDPAPGVRPGAGVAASAAHARATGIDAHALVRHGRHDREGVLLDDGEPLRRAASSRSRGCGASSAAAGCPSRPVLELIEIGAGGGSIAHIDRMGLPRSVRRAPGSEPGPACYGRGGDAPTVTDADLVLGLSRRRLFPRRRDGARRRRRARRHPCPRRRRRSG